LTGYTKEKKIVEAEIIRKCAAIYLLSKQQNEDAIEDLRASAKLILEPEKGIEPASSADSFQKIAKKAPSTPTGFKPAYVTAMSVVFLLSIFGYLYFFGENHAPYRNIKTFLGKAFDRYTGSKLETSSQKSDETATPQSNIAGTQVQALDVIAQKTLIENQLGQVKSRNEELTAELAELKGAKERIAELEEVAARREQTLSQAEQKLATLAAELDREKTSKETLNSERSMEAGVVAELQEKLEAALSSRAELENDVEKSKKEIAALQKQLLDVNAQKDAPENQLEQKRSSYEELTVDSQELKGLKERVAALEGDLATKDQTLSRSEQRISHLVKELDQEKQKRELLSSELSLKIDLVTEFQQKLKAFQINQQELEKTIKKSAKKNAKLQNQLRKLEAQKDPTESSSVTVEMKKKSTSQSEASGEGGKSRNPSDIIDWVLKKKVE
jgi:chromosome segregation ATPase